MYIYIRSIFEVKKEKKINVLLCFFMWVWLRWRERFWMKGRRENPVVVKRYIILCWFYVDFMFTGFFFCVGLLRICWLHWFVLVNTCYCTGIVWKILCWCYNDYHNGWWSLLQWPSLITDLHWSIVVIVIMIGGHLCDLCCSML